MLKKSGKSTESKKLKDKVTSSKTRIKKLPISRMKDWVEPKFEGLKSLVTDSSTKVKLSVLSLGLVGLGATAVPFVDWEKPIAALNALIESEGEPEPATKDQAKVEKVATEVKAVPPQALSLTAAKPASVTTKKELSQKSAVKKAAAKKVVRETAKKSKAKKMASKSPKKDKASKSKVRKSLASKDSK